MRLPIVVAVAILALSGCAGLPMGGPPSFVPQPQAGQAVKENPYAGGFAVQSEGQRSLARMQQVMGDNLEEHGALFKVIVINTGREPVSFGLEDIQVERGGKPAKLISRQALADLEGQKKSSGDTLGSLVQGGAVVGGMLAAAVTGWVGGANLSQSQMQSASQSIGGGVAASMEAGNKMKEAHSTASEARLELFDQVGLRQQTLEPGASGGGYFLVETPTMNVLDEAVVKVRLGGDEHRFRFKPKLF